MGLSIAQIVLSAAFFLLGMVDGFHIQFVHVSPMFLPCWIAALVGNISNDIYYPLNVDLHYSWFSRVLLSLFIRIYTLFNRQQKRCECFWVNFSVGSEGAMIGSHLINYSLFL